MNAGSNPVARTKIDTAVGFGMQETFKESEIVEKKRWVYVHDEKVRDWHKDVDPAPIGLDDKFQIELTDGSTEELEYPGDPSGSPENIINCRCVIVPVFIENHLHEVDIATGLARPLRSDIK